MVITIRIPTHDTSLNIIIIYIKKTLIHCQEWDFMWFSNIQYSTNSNLKLHNVYRRFLQIYIYIYRHRHKASKFVNIILAQKGKKSPLTISFIFIILFASFKSVSALPEVAQALESNSWIALLQALVLQHMGFAVPTLIVWNFISLQTSHSGGINTIL